MANLKVSELTAATSLASTDLVYAVVSGAGRKVTISDLTRQLYGSTSITMTVGGTERMRIDASGNLGLGVTPSAWGSGYKALDINTYAALYGTTAAAAIAGNAFFNGTNWIYKTTAASQLYVAGSGAHAWYTAPSGTAGNPITFTQAMTLDASGNLGIGTASPLVPLDVNGASLTRGVSYKYQPAQTSKSAAATLTIAELLTSIIQYTGAAANLTLPTGNAIDAGVPASLPVDLSFDFSIINTGSGAATVVTNTGLTTVGNLAVAAGDSGLFRVRKTAANTFTVYRIS